MARQRKRGRLDGGRLMAGVFALGCGPLIGADDYTVGEGDSPHDAGDSGAARTTKGGFRFAASCAQCLDARCGPELEACAADAACFSLVDCDAACEPGELACASLCAGRHPFMRSNAEPWDLASCRVSRCDEACGRPCGGWCTGNLNCDTCATEQCPAEAASVLADPASREALRCVQVGISGGCFLDGTPQPLLDYASCEQRCASCSRGAFRNEAPDLRCVGDVPRIAGAHKFEFQLEVYVAVGPPYEAVSGIRVQACHVGPGTCDDPGTTNDDGVASIVAHPGGDIFDYLEIEDTLSTPRIDPVIYVVAPPIVHDGARININISTGEAFDNWYALLGKVWDRPQFGNVIIEPLGCGKFRGRGFQLDSEDTGRVWYFERDSYVPNDQLRETTSAGFGGFVEATPGTYRFSARHPESAHKDGLVSEAVARVEAGWTTHVILAPSPLD